MAYVAIILALVLLQYTFFAFQVGSARGKYNVNAPAVSGHDMFDRYYRIQQNTLEQLVVFIPALFLFASYIHALTAAGFGLVFFIGRMIYYKAYIKDPKSRGLGFMLTFLPSMVLVIGALVGAVLQLI